LTGEGDYPNRLDAILYEDRSELTRARIAEDDRLIAAVDKYDDAALANLHSYKTTSGMPQSQVLSVCDMVSSNADFVVREFLHSYLCDVIWWQCVGGLRLIAASLPDGPARDAQRTPD